MFDGERHGARQVRLVATNIPEGLIVHTEPGVSKNPAGPSLSEVLRKELGPLKNLRAVRASDVGLQWIDSDGEKNKGSDKSADECFVLVSDKE